jgi:hypothetical protein
MAVALFGICLLTDMSSYADVASLQQREQRIRDSKSRQEKAMAATEMASLEHLQHQDQDQTQLSDSSDEYSSDALYAESLARSNHSRSSLENDHPSDDQDSIHSGTSSGPENPRMSLLSDYDICLGRLKAMQTTIEGALRSPTRFVTFVYAMGLTLPPIPRSLQTSSTTLRNSQLKPQCHRLRPPRIPPILLPSPPSSILPQ